MTTAAGISKDLVTTTQQAPLGFQLSVPTADGGVDIYTYVKAAQALAIGIVGAKGPTAADDSGYGGALQAVSAMPDMMYVGVAQQAIGVGEYGFLLTRGAGKVKVNSASATVAALVVHSANGEMDDATATATNSQQGMVLFTAIGAGAVGNAYVSFSG